MRSKQGLNSGFATYPAALSGRRRRRRGVQRLVASSLSLAFSGILGLLLVSPATANFCTTSSSQTGGLVTVRITAGIACDWTVPSGVTQLEVVVVGGGGGGGHSSSPFIGGGGGGGEVLYNPGFSVNAGQIFTITIGNGGIGSRLKPGSLERSAPGNGNNTEFGNIIAAGGGAGASYDPDKNFPASNVAARAGGSGGGERNGTTPAGRISVGQTPAGWTSFGSEGGLPTSRPYSSGGTDGTLQKAGRGGGAGGSGPSPSQGIFLMGQCLATGGAGSVSANRWGTPLAFDASENFEAAGCVDQNGNPAGIANGSKINVLPEPGTGGGGAFYSGSNDDNGITGATGIVIVRYALPVTLNTPNSITLAASSDSGVTGDAITNDATPTFTVGGLDSSQGLVIKASRGPSDVMCTFPNPASTQDCTFSSLTDGDWTVVAHQVAPPNQTLGPGLSFGTLRVDTVGPSAPTISRTDGSGLETLTFQLSNADGNPMRYTFGGETRNYTTAVVVSASSSQIPANSYGTTGNYVFEARAFDVAGNSSIAASETWQYTAPSPSPSPTPTQSQTPTPTPTQDPAPAPQVTQAPLPVPAPTPVPIQTPSPTPTPSPSATPLATPSPSITQSPTPSAAPTQSEQPTPTPSTSNSAAAPEPSESASPAETFAAVAQATSAFANVVTAQLASVTEFFGELIAGPEISFGEPTPNLAIGATGDDSAQPVEFDPLASPETVAAIADAASKVAAVAVAVAGAAVAGAAAAAVGGAAAGAAGAASSASAAGASAGSSTSTASQSSSYREYEGEREDEVTSLNVAVDQIGLTAVGWGDRLAIYSIGALNFMDNFSHRAAVVVSKFSPLLSKVFTDGSYLRAMFGSLSLIPVIVAGVLGVLAAQEFPGAQITPGWELLILIAILGVMDVMAGFAATLTYWITSLIFLGSLPSIDDIRSLMAVSVIALGPALLTTAFRKLRKEPAYTGSAKWERISDFAIAPFMAGWSVSIMVSVLPAVTGYTSSAANHITDFGIAVAAATALRVLLEEFVARVFPTRLDRINPTELPQPPLLQKFASLGFKYLIWVVVAQALIGPSWQAWIGSALFLIPTIIKWFDDYFPNSPFLWRILPSGVPGLAFSVLVAAATTSLVATITGDNPDLAAWNFVLLPLPLLVISALGWFGRHGANEHDKKISQRSNLLYRVGGVVVFFFTLNLVGII